MMTEQMIEMVAIAYTNAGKRWMRIEDIAAAAGLTGPQMAVVVRELMAEDDFHAEPQPFNDRITEWDKANAPVIGGEARHLINWE